jgi:hypothetical protein
MDAFFVQGSFLSAGGRVVRCARFHGARTVRDRFSRSGMGRAVLFVFVMALSGCDALNGMLGETEEGTPSLPVQSYFVRSGGTDGEARGETREAPFATLTYAYNRALADPTHKRIVILESLSQSSAFVLDAGTEGQSGHITIQGEGTGIKLSITADANKSVVEAKGGANITFENITINGNPSPDGPSNRGMMVTGPGTVVTLGNGAVITGKKSAGDSDGPEESGSGVLVADGAAFVIDGGVVTDCFMEGGAGTLLVTGAGSRLSLNRGEICKNTSSVGGGVAILSGSIFTLNGGEIRDNTAVGGRGGGVFLMQEGAADPLFAMHGGTISGNKALQPNEADDGMPYGGGGVMLMGGVFVMKGGEIRENDTASGQGGGINVYGGRFIMWNGAIKDNVAAGSGGGVYLDLAEFTMENGDITGNAAGFQEGNPYDGGGVCLAENTMIGETLYGAQFIMERGRINDNSATGSGGGIAVLGGMFRIKGGEVNGNTAVVAASGIKVSSTGQFIQNGGQIGDNILIDPPAQQGGGEGEGGEGEGGGGA